MCIRDSVNAATLAAVKAFNTEHISKPAMKHSLFFFLIMQNIDHSLSLIHIFEHGLHMIVPAYANSTQDNEYMTREQAYHYYNEFLWQMCIRDRKRMKPFLKKAVLSASLRYRA